MILQLQSNSYQWLGNIPVTVGWQTSPGRQWFEYRCCSYESHSSNAQHLRTWWWERVEPTTQQTVQEDLFVTISSGIWLLYGYRGTYSTNRKGMKIVIITFIEDALQISTATHKDTSCACSKRFSRWPSVLGSLTYIFCSQGRGASPELGSSETRRLPVLKPKMLSRSLVGDWLLPTPMPCAREFRKCTGWMWKNKSWNRIKDIRLSEVYPSVFWCRVD